LDLSLFGSFMGQAAVHANVDRLHGYFRGRATGAGKAIDAGLSRTNLQEWLKRDVCAPASSGIAGGQGDGGVHRRSI